MPKNAGNNEWWPVIATQIRHDHCNLDIESQLFLFNKFT